MFNCSWKNNFQIKIYQFEETKNEVWTKNKKINQVSHASSFSKVWPCALCIMKFLTHNVINAISNILDKGNSNTGWIKYGTIMSSKRYNIQRLNFFNIH